MDEKAILASLSLGQRVAFKNSLKRGYDSSKMSGSPRKEWKPRWQSNHPYAAKMKNNPEVSGTGVVVGIRVLADGKVEYGGYDEGTSFHPDNHFQAVLVSFDLRRNPVYVLPEDLTILY